MVTRRLAILGRLSYPNDAALADRSAGFPAAYSSRGGEVAGRDGHPGRPPDGRRMADR